jgi:cytochrome P450
MLQPILDQRKREKEAAVAEGRAPPRHDDTITWLEEESVRSGRKYDPVATQLGYAMGALHTSTELLKQTLLDIYSHPELIQPIREEVKKAVEEGGWSKEGVFKMQLLDSVVKESQRLKPGSLGEWLNSRLLLVQSSVANSGI